METEISSSERSVGQTPKVALVTGGTRGMGRVMVQALLEEGFIVVALGRYEKSTRELREALGGNTERLRTMFVDLASGQAPEDTVAKVLESERRIDVLINNAGIGTGSIRADSWQNPVPFWEVTAEQWREFSAIHAEVTLPARTGRYAGDDCAAMGTPYRQYHGSQQHDLSRAHSLRPMQGIG
ncbi:NAD(P)-dependent dehydrogenase (short-subunit alcohol dehydrogenase family) [Bradyrhizobium sp. AZCC 2262]|uniref:SDR family NAD(P)-dependent oxidoreductase n=1 Tax=Bradyrhizobium sp. AZCC 2262 TaxID=3117022 RepID=UPI002FF3BA52